MQIFQFRLSLELEFWGISKQRSGAFGAQELKIQLLKTTDTNTMNSNQVFEGCPGTQVMAKFVGADRDLN